MINILVDECYAFDYLSILEVKKIHNPKHEIYFLDCLNYIKNQIPNIFEAIIDSKEYKELLESNKLTFEAVDRARYGSISAKEVDECNMLRYQKKINLQKAFFPESLIVEKKT